MTPLPSPRVGEERPVDRRMVQSFSWLGSFLSWHFQRHAHLEGLMALVDGQQITAKISEESAMALV